MSHLEDELCDVVSKAQRGLGLATSNLAKQAGLSPASARALRAGSWTDEHLAAAAPVLGLRLEGLQRLAENRWAPEAKPGPDLVVVDLPAPMSGYEAMRVNAFLACPLDSDDAFLFDTGTDAAVIADEISARHRTLRAIYITHAHWDHCDSLPALRARFPVTPVFGPADPALAPLNPLHGGEQQDWNSVTIQVSETAGHCPQSLSYLIGGLSQPVVIVGDAIFAGSVGGIPESDYAAALRAIRKKLLSLPDETLIAPGHGSLTTVGYERRHNPFFPETKNIME